MSQVFARHFSRFVEKFYGGDLNFSSARL